MLRAEHRVELNWQTARKRLSRLWMPSLVCFGVFGVSGCSEWVVLKKPDLLLGPRCRILTLAPHQTLPITVRPLRCEAALSKKC